jgi:predicted Zn-dependent protease
VIQPGRGKLEDLVSDVKKGVLCMNTYDRPNMTTGDLSAMVSEGFYIEDGELRKGLKNTLIGINMRDLLKRVNRVGADTRVTGRMVTPSVVVDSAKITSG